MNEQHKKKAAGHGGTCAHCGGLVAEDGYVHGLGEAEEFEPFEHKETDQYEATVDMRHDAGAGFANAIKHNFRGYAEPESTENSQQDFEKVPQSKPVNEAADELRRKKIERYGFGSKNP